MEKYTEVLAKVAEIQERVDALCEGCKRETVADIHDHMKARAIFIRNAPDDIRFLLAENDRLQVEVDVKTAALEAIKQTLNTLDAVENTQMQLVMTILRIASLVSNLDQPAVTNEA